MSMVEFFIGLAIGIFIGALLQNHHTNDQKDNRSDLVQLLEEADKRVGKDESLSITLVATKDDLNGGGDDNMIVPDLSPEMMENWRNN